VNPHPGVLILLHSALQSAVVFLRANQGYLQKFCLQINKTAEGANYSKVKSWLKQTPFIIKIRKYYYLFVLARNF